jgi:hypothetical protein
MRKIPIIAEMSFTLRGRAAICSDGNFIRFRADRTMAYRQGDVIDFHFGVAAAGAQMLDRCVGDGIARVNCASMIFVRSDLLRGGPIDNRILAQCFLAWNACPLSQRQPAILILSKAHAICASYEISAQSN